MGVIEADIRSFTYDGDDVPTLRDVRLVVERGELVVQTALLVQGKTALIKRKQRGKARVAVAVQSDQRHFISAFPPTRIP